MSNQTKPRPPVLILGGDSEIGKALKYKLNSYEWNTVSTTRRKNRIFCESLMYLDLQDHFSIKKVCSRNYACAVICAGITKINYCETFTHNSNEINVNGIKKSIDELLIQNTPIIFLSTNLVFDGRLIYPNIFDKANPITQYGKQKLSIEKYLAKCDGKITIVRLTKVVNNFAGLFADWIHQLKHKETISAYSNKFFAPISIDYVTDILASLLDHNCPGIYQISASYQISYFQAALYLAKSLGVEKELVLAQHDLDKYNNFIQTNNALKFTFCFPKFVAPDPYRTISSLL